MSKKKKGTTKPKPKQHNMIEHRLDDEMSLVNGAAQRVNTVIQKIIEPPETVINHLERIGIKPIIDQMILDDGDPRTYVLIDYEELLKKELDSITKGSTFTDSYPKDRPYNPIKTSTEPIMLEEIRKRMQEAMARHPSQLSIDDIHDGCAEEIMDEEDDWQTYDLATEDNQK